MKPTPDSSSRATVPQTASPPLSVGSPGDLIAAVPYLLGFHPADSLVVVALRGSCVIFAARSDLPAPGAPADQVRSLSGYVASVVARQGGDATMIIGYGPESSVAAVLSDAAQALADRGLKVIEALRVHDGRFWSCLCTDARCCPPGGTRFDPAASPVAAAATYAGHVALPDRSALVRRLAPVDGAARESMRLAARRAGERIGRLLAAAPTADVLGGRVLRAAGEEAVTELLERGRSGGRPTDDQVAWSSLLLTHVPVRDFAWRRAGDGSWQLDLWSDIVRRAEPKHVPAPACLLAFAAWRAGQGALANVALDRALAEDPRYSLALLLREAFDQGLPPSALGQ